MNPKSLTKKSLLALGLLVIEYSLLGWYLAAHHIFWLVGGFIVVTTTALTWKRSPILRSLVHLIGQRMLVVIGTILLISLAIATALSTPLVLSLALLPALTLLYALLEMQVANVKQVDVFFWSVVITGFSLGLGEAIDLFVIPSMRY